MVLNIYERIWVCVSVDLSNLVTKRIVVFVTGRCHTDLPKHEIGGLFFFILPYPVSAITSHCGLIFHILYFVKVIVKCQNEYLNNRR